MKRNYETINLTCDEIIDDVRKDDAATQGHMFEVTYSSCSLDRDLLDACTDRMTAIEMREPKKTIDVGSDYNDELFRSREVLVDMYDTIIDKINDTQYRQLVSWMITVMDEWGHHDTAVHVAVDVLNRYLYTVHLTRGLFQLAGMAAIWIADKLVHVYPNTCQQYVNMADTAYTKRELQNMELAMLKTLEWRILQVPKTSQTFALHYIRQSSVTVDSKFVDYLLCAGFTDQMHMKHAPSILAEAAVFIASVVFDPDFGASLEPIAGFRPALISAVAMLCGVGSLNLRKHERSGSADIQEKYWRTLNPYSSPDMTDRLTLVMDRCRA